MKSLNRANNPDSIFFIMKSHKKRSILFIHHGTIIGGAPISLFLQVKGIVDRRIFECKIACNSEEMQIFFSNKGIESIPWPYPCTHFGKVLIRHSKINNFHALFLFINDCIFFPISIAKQIILLHRSEEKIIHLNSAVLFSTALAARITRKKIVWHIREASNFPKIVQLFIKKFADKIICISEIEASRLGKISPKIHVIFNPIDFTRFKAELYSIKEERAKLGIPLNANVIVSFGGINPRKGAKEIIDALKYCDPNTYAVFAGPPLRTDQHDTYHKNVEQSCKIVGNNRVIIKGVVENPAPLLACADILVFAGMSPHFPRPIFEAWAMKKPVMVFEMEGISNQVDHMINGVIVREISSQALGIAIKNIIENKDLLHAMGSVGYKKACSLVSQEGSSRAVEQILSDLIVN